MKNFDEKEVERLFKEIQQDIFKFKSVQNVNFRPHAFMIGTRHIVHASDNFGGMIGREAILSLERKLRTGSCYHKGCNKFYDEHDCDTVCFLQLKRNATQEEATEVLKQMNEKASTMYDGYCFVDTDEKFRIS